MRQRRSELVVGAVLTAVVWAATAVYALVSPGMRELSTEPAAPREPELSSVTSE